MRYFRGASHRAIYQSACIIGSKRSFAWNCNRSLRQLLKEGYIDDNIRLTKKAENEFADKAPKQAIILAAGFGMRMVPINLESPKAFLQVNGEYLD